MHALRRLLVVEDEAGVAKGDPERKSERSLLVNPWCCHVTAADLRTSAAVLRSQNERFVRLRLGDPPWGGWGWPTLYFDRRLDPLVAGLMRSYQTSHGACALALIRKLQTGRPNGSTFHALHLRAADKQPCPLLDCEACGLVSRRAGATFASGTSKTPHDACTAPLIGGRESLIPQP